MFPIRFSATISRRRGTETPAGGTLPRALCVGFAVVAAWLLAVGPALPQYRQYRDIADEAGLTVVTGTGGPEKNHIAESTGTGVAVFDYDQDGLPDLYFPNAPSWDAPAGGWRFRPGALYRNRCGARFTDVTESAGVGAAVYGQ